MKKIIKLLVATNDGEVAFMIGPDKYRYYGIDGLAIDDINKYHRMNKDGTALNIAKKEAASWEKE